MSELAKLLIGILTPTITALLGIIVGLIKAYTSKKKREKELIELINYAMGWVDTVLLEQVKMKPDLKKAGEKVSKRYHKLDVVKEVKE